MNFYVTDDIKDQIKAIPPESLEAHGVISPAKTMAYNRHTYICPVCQNGTKENGDGMYVDDTKPGIYFYRCEGCARSYENIHLFAFHYGLDLHYDFQEICQRACDEFGISYDDKPKSDYEKCVYALKMSNGFVKIGITGNIDIRKKQVASSSGLDVVDSFNTSMLPDVTARAIEFDCLKIFKEFRTNGEFFNIDFVDACSKINAHFNDNGDGELRYFAFLKSNQVAEVLGVSRQTVKKWRDQKTLNPDFTDHNGYFLYDAQKIMQLKSDRQLTEPNSAEIELIRKDISDAQANLEKFVANHGGKWRGLTLDTLKHFRCGFLPNWTSPKSRVNGSFSKPTPRFIVPSGDHYLARLTVPIESFPQNDRPFIKPKMHAGSKDLFNADFLNKSKEQCGYIDALPVSDVLTFSKREENASIPCKHPVNPPVNQYTKELSAYIFAVEGEFDAMSLFQAGFNAVATMGAGGFPKFVDNVQNSNLQVIILFDPDDTGRKNAAAFKDKLDAAGVKSAIAFLDDHNSKLDANDILVNQGVDALKFKIASIVQNATFDVKSRELQRLSNNPDSPKSTLQIIPSCPLDLQVPFGFNFTEFGISRKNKLIVSTPIIVTKLFEPQDGGVVAVELAFYKRITDSWRRVTVDLNAIADSKKILLLANHGVTIVQENAKHLSVFLMRIIDFQNNASVIPTIRIFNQPGWHNDEFISPYKSDCDYVIKDFGVDYHCVFKQSGDKAIWLDLFKCALDASPVVRLVCGASLAAVALNIANLRSVQIHLAAPSGNGKTAAVKLALSIFGDPNELLKTFNSTSKSILEIASKFNDLPHGVDEFQAASKKEREMIDDSIYQLAGMQGRARLNRDGSLRPVPKFRTVRLTTGEQTLTSQFSGQGAIRRVLEICVDHILFDDWAALIHSTLEQGHFGFFGEHWIHFLAYHKSDFLDLYRDFLDTARACLPNAISDHINAVAVSYAAAYLFDRSINGVLPNFKALFPDDLKVLFAAVPDKNASSNIERARDVLEDYLFSHASFFITQDRDSGVFAEPPSREAYGVKFADGCVGFFKSGLTAILDKCNFPSSNAIIKGFVDAGFFQGNTTGKHLGQIKRTIDNHGKRTWLYLFKPDILNCAPDEIDD